MNFVKYISYAAMTWISESWFFMLGVGVIHGWWWRQVPTIGFGASMLLSFLFLSLLSGGSLVTVAYFKGWLRSSLQS